MLEVATALFEEKKNIINAIQSFFYQQEAIQGEQKFWLMTTKII